MYPDNIGLLKKLQELFSARKKILDSKTQTTELRKLLTQIVWLQKAIERNDNKFTDKEELQLQELLEDKNYNAENVYIKLLVLLHRCRNKQDPLSHLELAKIYADDGFYQEAALYYEWVTTNSKDEKFLGSAYYSLGFLFEHGNLQPTDSSKNPTDVAIDWYKKSAEQNFLMAYFNSGCLYEKKMNFKAARGCYIKLVQALDPTKPYSVEVQHAIYRSARMAALGLGMDKNLIEAKHLYTNLVKIYFYKEAMFDLAEILFEEKDFVEAEKNYDLFIEKSREVVDQDIALKKMDALYKLELIEETEKALSAENAKQKKLQKKLEKDKSKQNEKTTSEKIDLEFLILEADKLLSDKNYKESKKKFLEIKSSIENKMDKFKFLDLDEKNIVWYVKCVWGVANNLFGQKRLAGANNLYKDCLNYIEAYMANHNGMDELIAARYEIEADMQAIAAKLNLEAADLEIDEESIAITQNSEKKKSKKKKKPAKPSSVFGHDVVREILNVTIPNRAMMILKILQEHGAFYIYGGFVRDSWLKISAGDIDVISKILPEKVKQILDDYFAKNIDTIDPELRPKKIQLKKHFQGLVISYSDNEHIDITTFRDYDDKTQYDPNKFGNFVTHSRIYDLTINGLFLDPFTKEIIDLVGGVFDLREKNLRVNDPENFFKLDPARMLRVIRFTAQFPEFTLVDQVKIFKYIDEYCYMVNDLKKISRGKLFFEISALFSHRRGLMAYKLLKTTKLLPFLFPHFPVLKSQGYLETNFFSFDQFIEKVLEKSRDASKPEHYGLPLLLAVILWPLLIDQLRKFNRNFTLAEIHVRKLQVFDIPEKVWRDTRLIWAIHYYKNVPLTMNNVETHFMAQTFSTLAVEASKDWQDVKKMLAEKKQQAFLYSQVSQLPQMFSLFSSQASFEEKSHKTLEKTS